MKNGENLKDKVLTYTVHKKAISTFIGHVLLRVGIKLITNGTMYIYSVYNCTVNEAGMIHILGSSRASVK